MISGTGGTIWITRPSARGFVVLSGLLLAACGPRGEGDAKTPSSPNEATRAEAESTPSEGAPGVNGELPKPLDYYTDPQRDDGASEFFELFAPASDKKVIEYGAESGVLTRWCDNTGSCGAKAQPAMDSRKIALDALPANGVIMGVFRLWTSRNKEDMYGLKRANRALYFLVVTPKSPAQKFTADWHFVGIEQQGGKYSFVYPDKSKGEFVPCDTTDDQHPTDLAGFEPCKTKSELMAEGPGKFESKLVAHRDSIIMTYIEAIEGGVSGPGPRQVLGPMDFAWTTCAAGCCRATF